MVRGLLGVGSRGEGVGDEGRGRAQGHVSVTCVSAGGARFVVAEVRDGVEETGRGRKRQAGAVSRGLRAHGVSRPHLGVLVESRAVSGRRWGQRGGGGDLFEERAAEVVDGACGWIRVLVDPESLREARDGSCAQPQDMDVCDGPSGEAAAVLRRVRGKLAASEEEEELGVAGGGMARVVYGEAERGSFASGRAGWAGLVLFAAVAGALREESEKACRPGIFRAVLRGLGFPWRPGGVGYLGLGADSGGAIGAKEVPDLPAALDTHRRMKEWPSREEEQRVAFRASPGEGIAAAQVQVGGHVVAGTRAHAHNYVQLSHGVRLDAGPARVQAQLGPGDRLAAVWALDGAVPGVPVQVLSEGHRAEVFLLHAAGLWRRRTRENDVDSDTASTVLGVSVTDPQEDAGFSGCGRVTEKEGAVCVWIPGSEIEPVAGFNLELRSRPNHGGNGPRGGLRGTAATLGVTLHALRTLTDVVMNCSARVPLRFAAVEPALCLTGRGSGLLSLGLHAPL